MACTHHAPPPAPADPTVGKLETPCPSPKSATTDAAEYERFVATKWCRIIEGNKETVTEQLTFGTDGREVLRRWTSDASGKRRDEKVVHEDCWRLDGPELHEVRLTDGRDFHTGHEFEEDGGLDISVFDMDITYRACPKPTP